MNTKQSQVLLVQQIEVTVKQQAKLHYQKGVLSFATDIHVALSDFIRATQLDPDNALFVN